MRYLMWICLALSVSPVLAITRFGSPIASSRWDEFLPQPAHPNFPSDLGSVREGCLGVGFQNSNLGNLSLSMPGFQVVSAETRWKPVDSLIVYSFDPDLEPYFLENSQQQTRYRSYFQIAGGLSLSDLLNRVQSWDVGLGLSMETVQLLDEDRENEFWTRRDIGFGVSLRWLGLSAAGFWTPSEFRYRLGFERPADWQLGILIYQNPEADKALGGEIGGEKTFQQFLRFKGGLRLQYVSRNMVERKMLVGVAWRFRPWREGIDPSWTRAFVSPMQSSPEYARFLYDWEVAVDVAVDQAYGSTDEAFTISRWF
ncbi:MAG TPA: hypothetical protein VLM37_00200 [Fibrobacteraceae bacterium]|nr:hypothetical protein [Fibrobacteraceae bacterium]